MTFLEVYGRSKSYGSLFRYDQWPECLNVGFCRDCCDDGDHLRVYLGHDQTPMTWTPSMGDVFKLEGWLWIERNAK